MSQSFSAYCEYLEQNLATVKLAALESFKIMLRNITAEEVIEKAKKGRKQYGGTFDIETIAAMAELRAECVDMLAYQGMHDLQTDH